METARARLAPLLEGHELTAGMSIRIHGDHLILARSDPETEAGTTDRVRLTRLVSKGTPADGSARRSPAP